MVDARFSAYVSGTDLLDLSQGLAVYSVVGEEQTQLLSGKAPVIVDVAVGDDMQFSINSTLSGLAVDLPKPLGKTADSEAPVSVIFQPNKPTSVEAFWFERLQGKVFQGEAGI